MRTEVLLLNSRSGAEEIHTVPLTSLSQPGRRGYHGESGGKRPSEVGWAWKQGAAAGVHTGRPCGLSWPCFQGREGRACTPLHGTCGFEHNHPHFLRPQGQEGAHDGIPRRQTRH